jgi:hypothetical protein
MNAHADACLMARFRNSGHTSIKSLIGSHDVEIPKVSGKDACLQWAFKGLCNDNCKRKGQHVRYGRPVIQRLHTMLDICGVANPQP